MPAKFSKLNKRFCDFIRSQQLFFVATADREGRVNLSPKGLDTLRILSDNRIVWLSLSGSGNETAGHLVRCDRITLMFCAFQGDALILRVYGQATVVHPHDDQWTQLAGLFAPLPGARQIFDVHIDMVQTSCGSGVPVFQYQHQRGPGEMLPFYAAMTQAELEHYWATRNAISIDGKATGIIGQ